MQVCVLVYFINDITHYRNKFWMNTIIVFLWAWCVLAEGNSADQCFPTKLLSRERERFSEQATVVLQLEGAETFQSKEGERLKRSSQAKKSLWRSCAVGGHILAPQNSLQFEDTCEYLTHYNTDIAFTPLCVWSNEATSIWCTATSAPLTSGGVVGLRHFPFGRAVLHWGKCYPISIATEGLLTVEQL